MLINQTEIEVAAYVPPTKVIQLLINVVVCYYGNELLKWHVTMVTHTY